MKNLYLLISLFISNILWANGTLSGKVVDGKTGETLIGVSVLVENTSYATVTDLDGNYLINDIAAGTYTVVYKYIGYENFTANNIVIRNNENTTQNVVLNTGEINLKTVEVKAQVKRESASAVYLIQKNSTIIQSGISSEDIKKSPDRNTGEALKRVSGASLQDGRFAIIRGLSDRYNNAMLNENLLPSTEPDRKTFAFDIFPANIVDNILILKTAQPDMPSEFAGGIVQINTKSIPEKNFFNATYGISFIEQTTFKRYNAYAGSKTDFLGIDNKRALPSTFPSAINLHNLQVSYADAARQEVIKINSQLINQNWATNQKIATPNQSLQLSGGFNKKWKNISVGAVMALSYNYATKNTMGERNRQEINGTPYYNFTDIKSNISTNTAVLANFSLIIKNNHKINFKNLFTINSDNNTIERTGTSFVNNVAVKRTSLEFITNQVINTGINGNHYFEKEKIKLNWNGGFILVKRNQPNTRRFSYEKNLNDTLPYQYISGAQDPLLSSMFYSNLNEKVLNAGFDVSNELKMFSKKDNIKVGMFYQNRNRDFNARTFYAYVNNHSLDTLGVENIITPQNYNLGNISVIQQNFEQGLIYKAQSNLTAAFVMFTNNFTPKLKAVWGFRMEYFNQQMNIPNKQIDTSYYDPINGVVTVYKTVDSIYTTKYFSGISKSDTNGAPILDKHGIQKSNFPLLPSINLIYSLNETMNLRFSYGQTITRPEFRELSAFHYFDFVADAGLSGNSKLQQTLIHNFDLRYEYFMGKGQVFNATFFAKKFTNTIEQTAIANGSSQEFQYNNAQSAFLVGAEIEFRKRLDFIHKSLIDLQFISNFAYIYSSVDVSKIKNNAGDESKRSMQGQSPFIINLGLMYQHPKIGFGATVLYNQIGHRLIAIGEVGNPSWYENSRPILDLQFSQKVGKYLTFKLTFSDLIAMPQLFYQNAANTPKSYQKGKDFIVRKEQNYRGYNFQLNFSF